MNRTLISGWVGAAALLLSSGPSFGFGGMIAIGMSNANEMGEVEVPFVADAKMETEEYNIDTRIYYKPGKIRDEMTMEGQGTVYIHRLDLRKTWMIMPQGLYMEFDQGELEQEGNQQMQQYRLIEREVIGQETVNGMETTKYKVIYESDDGRYGGFTWFTEDNIAVKSFMISETQGEKVRVKFEMTNLERGDQADALFELPAGAQKFDMGNMPGMGGAAGAQPGASAMGGGSGAQSGMGGGAQPGTEVMTGGPEEPAAQTQDPNAPEDPTLTDKMGEAAQQGAEDAAVQETRRGVQDAVGKGIRSLFGK